ncbi:MAG: histidine kinase dimerization/phospho-acceptor domain-containing protein, partial [Thermoanaerobaculia bacterium]
MVEPAGGKSAVAGFRRDVTLFLSALFGFLVVLILVLLTTVQVLIGQSEEARREQRRESANRATTALNALDTSMGTAAIEAALVGIVNESGVDRIELETRVGPTVAAGEAEEIAREILTAQTRMGPARYLFDARASQSLRRRFLYTAAICFAAAAIGMILLLIYIRRIARPVEALLEEAAGVGQPASGVDETEYLLDTFRRTIATLRSQEAELKMLHDREKARADDLERITSTLTRSLTSGFLALDPAGRVVQLNEAGRAILGISAPASGPPVEALGDSPFARKLDEAFRKRETLNRTEVRLGEDPETGTIGVTTVHLEDDRGRYLGMLALFTDLTPIRRLEDRLRETRALADLGEVAAGIAHEFRNSLATILGYLKLASRSPDQEDRQRKLTAAESEAAELGNAVTTLLHFASPVQIHPVELGLRELTETVVHRISDVAVGGVEIRVEGPEVDIAGDPALLARAIENVLRNAVSAVEATG